MKAHDFRNLSVEELKDRVRSLQDDVYKFRMDVLTGKEKNSAHISSLKKDLARAKTVLLEKSSGGA